MQPNSKYTLISIYAIVAFAVCCLIGVLFLNFREVWIYLGSVFKTLSPVIWGFVIAFILNPIMVKFEDLFKFMERKKPHPKLKRVLSLLIAVVISLIVITVFFIAAIPQLIESIQGIFQNLDYYINSLEKLTTEYLYHNETLNNRFNIGFDEISNWLKTQWNDFQPQMKNLALSTASGIWSFVIGIKDFLLGYIVAIYLLYSKELFIAQSKKSIIAIFNEKTARGMLYVSSKTNRILKGFFIGKVLDSLIIGLMNFIGMTIFGMKFAVLISFIIGITNIIPFFGPFIGAVPSILLLLVDDPKNAIIFAVFILALQQFDGNILGPKILGDSIGLPAFWIIFSILVGGGLFKFAGMLLSVPIFAVFYELIREYIEYKLKKKKLSASTAEYLESSETIENLMVNDNDFK